jgi:hypothetical protein
MATSRLTNLRHEQLTPHLLICHILTHAHLQIVSILNGQKLTPSPINQVASPVEALRQGSFDGVFEKHHGTSPPAVGKSAEYTKHPVNDAYFKMSHQLPSPENNEMEEYWRKVVVDVTNAMPPSVSQAKGQITELSNG